MELMQLRYFIMVAKSASMASASYVLSVSQSTLSISIKALEEELGVSLFEKRGRRKELTPIGETFLEQVEPIIEGLDALKDRIGIAGQQSSKLLTVAIEAVDFATELILAYRSQHPDVDIMQVRPNRKNARALLLSRADICIGLFDDSGYEFESHLMYSDRIKLLVPSGGPLAEKGEIALRDIPEETLITLPKEYGLRQLHEQFYRQAGIRLHRVFEVGDPETMPLPVQNAHGVTFISETQYHTVSNPPSPDNGARVLVNYDSLRHLAALDISDIPCQHNIYLTTCRRTKPSAECLDFMEFARGFSRECRKYGVYATQKYGGGRVNPFLG